MTYAEPTKLYVERERPFFKRDTVSNVDQVGFVTFEQQVNSLLLAGERVMAWKREAYDFPDGEVDEVSAKPDPTMDVGFDMADASEILRKTQEDIELAKAEKEVAEKEPSVSAESSLVADDKT